jgi:hypothetical protein
MHKTIKNKKFGMEGVLKCQVYYFSIKKNSKNANSVNTNRVYHKNIA